MSACPNVSESPHLSAQEPCLLQSPGPSLPALTPAPSTHLSSSGFGHASVPLGWPGLAPGLPPAQPAWALAGVDSLWSPGPWDLQVGFPRCCPAQPPSAACPAPAGQARCQLQLLAWAGDTGLAECPPDSAASGISLSLRRGEGSHSSKGPEEGPSGVLQTGMPPAVAGTFQAPCSAGLPLPPTTHG